MSGSTVFEHRDGVVQVMTSGPCPACDDTFPAPRLAVIGGSLAYTSCPAHPTSVRATSPEGAVFTVHVGHRPGLLDAWEEVRTNPAVLLRALDQIVTAPGSWLIDARAPAQEQRAQVLRAVTWAAYGHRRPSAREWILAGLEQPWEAGAWQAERLTAQECAVWREAGFADPKEVLGWRVGRATPQQAKQFGDLKAWAFCQQDGVPLDPEWGQLWTVVDPEFAATGAQQRQRPQAVARLGTALSRGLPEERVMERALYAAGAMLRSPWSRHRTAALCEDARCARGLDWADVAACIDAGMTIEAACELIRSGADLDPYRLLAALT